MGFATGHTQPANFAAGQISDGASVGTFALGSFAGVSGALLAVFIRSYQGKLVGLAEVRKPDGSVLPNEGMSIKQREYFNNLLNDPNYAGSKYPALTALVPLLATQSDLSSMGLAPEGQVPGTASGKLAFTQDADGLIKAGGTATTPPSTPVTPTTPGTTPTPGNPLTTPTTTTPTADDNMAKYKKWGMYAGIALAVVGVAYGVYVFVIKKKTGKRNGK